MAYTQPRTLTVKISSPQLALYTTLVQVLDRLMMEIDVLWLNRALSNKERKNAVYAWRVELLEVGRRIVLLERRAREAAVRQGKGDEVEEATGDVAVVVEDGGMESEPPRSDPTGSRSRDLGGQRPAVGVVCALTRAESLALLGQRQRHMDDIVDALHRHGQSAAGKDGEHRAVTRQHLRFQPC